MEIFRQAIVLISFNLYFLKSFIQWEVKILSKGVLISLLFSSFVNKFDHIPLMQFFLTIHHAKWNKSREQGFFPLKKNHIWRLTLRCNRNYVNCPAKRKIKDLIFLRIMFCIDKKYSRQTTIMLSFHCRRPKHSCVGIAD